MYIFGDGTRQRRVDSYRTSFANEHFFFLSNYIRAQQHIKRVALGDPTRRSILIIMMLSNDF